MKSLAMLALAFVLTGCAAIAPAIPTATAGPTSTAQVVFQTVIVTVLVTEPPTITPSPTVTWTPIPTFTPQPNTATSTLGTPGTPATASTTGTVQTPPASFTSATATLPTDAGGGLFTNLTRSTDVFAVTCQPDTVTFGLSTTNPSVTEVDLFYRLEDYVGSSITNWVDIGKMLPDNSGNFTFNFKSTLIPSDLRTRKAWLDYQFVGLNGLGQIVGRSARIVKQVTFSPGCPG
jgi:hypothetical protein